MKHSDYVERVSQRDAGFATRLKAARAVLDFGLLIHEQMATANLALDDVSRATGMSGERIAAIIDGETPLLNEVVLLCAALMMCIRIDNGFQIQRSRLLAVSAPSSDQAVPFVTSIGPPQ